MMMELKNFEKKPGAIAISECYGCKAFVFEYPRIPPILFFRSTLEIQEKSRPGTESLSILWGTAFIRLSKSFNFRGPQGQFLYFKSDLIQLHHLRDKPKCKMSKN